MALALADLTTKLKTMTGSGDTDAMNDALQSALDLVDTHRTWKYGLKTDSFQTTIDEPYYDMSTKIAGLGRVLRLYMTTPTYRQILATDGHDFVSNLADQTEPTDYAQHYWFEGDNRIRLWPTPQSVYTIQCYYARYHGDITAVGATIFFPEKFKSVLLHLAKQYYKGDIDSLDRMMDADPYIRTMWQQFIAHETVKDPTYRRRDQGWGRFRINASLT